MKRLLLAGAIGAALSYFLDRQRGKERRHQLLTFWQQSQDTALEAGRQVGSLVEPATPVPAQVVKRLSADRGSKGDTVRRLLAVSVATALVAGVLAYLMDPTRGSQRRESLRRLCERAVDTAREIGLRAVSAGQRMISPHVGEAIPAKTPRRKS